MVDNIKMRILKVKGKEKDAFFMGLGLLVVAFLAFILGRTGLGWLLVTLGISSIITGLMCYYLQFKMVYENIKEDVDMVKTFVEPLKDLKATPTRSGRHSSRKDVTNSLHD